MFPGAQLCFQLLRIGSSSNANGHSCVLDSACDLYTFRPALAQSVFRLGRSTELCDVTLNSTTVSRVHAELHAEREPDAAGEEGWKVQVKDRSSYGTWVNDVRIQQGVLLELFDGDTLTFGGQSVRGSPEFYFLFQKVRVSPQDFDAITVPKANSFSSNFNNRIRTHVDCKPEPNHDISKISINKATVILNSIGSLSKINGSNWTFRGADKSTNLNSANTASFPGLMPPSTSLSLVNTEMTKSVLPSTKSRRKSAHTVLLEDDSLDDAVVCRTSLEDVQKAQGGKRRHLYKSESSLSKMELSTKPQFDSRTVIAKHNGDMYNHSSSGKLNSSSFTSVLKHGHVNKGHTSSISVVGCRQLKSCSSVSRGRRRVYSTPSCSPLLVGSENFHLAYPPMKLAKVVRGQAARFHGTTGSSGHNVLWEKRFVTHLSDFFSLSCRRRGRPRKHPPPQPSLPSPSSSSSSSNSSSSSSTSSSSDEDDENDEHIVAVQGVEPCAAVHCRLPQQDTVQWVQCDDCDAWYHLDCLPSKRSQASFLLDPSAEFHCGCC